MKLLYDQSLEASSVVANSLMNRERGANGVNSYEKDIGVDAIAFLVEELNDKKSASWLDVCCGRGRALIDTAKALRHLAAERSITLHGVDLVDAFDEIPSEDNCLWFQAASLHQWRPKCRYDLITCVHGLHYVGDKLSVIEWATSALTPGGLFVANLDLGALRAVNGDSLGRRISKQFRESGLIYEARRKLITCTGHKSLSYGYRYLGADDQAGPNYSGQDAVDSYYEPMS